MLPVAVQSGSSAPGSFPPTSMPVGNPQQPMYFSDLATACKDNGQFDDAQRIDEAVVQGLSHGRRNGPAATRLKGILIARLQSPVNNKPNPGNSAPR